MLRRLAVGLCLIACRSPEAPPPPPPTLAETGSATALGLDGLSVNGRIQPRGRPTTFWFELGATTEYGAVTTASPVPPKLGAYYRETWDDGLAGWAGGLSGTLLEHVPTGGVEGGFVRYTMPGELDAAHADGIGANELIQYLYVWDGVPVHSALGGGDPDFRGARISVHVRGNDFVQKTSELVFWMQSTPDLGASYDDATARWSNWAYSGASLTESLFSGRWESASYTLHADSNAWTYAGHYVAAGRETYVYVPLDQVLGHQNGDFFHMLTFFEYGDAPGGSIDVDEIEIAYPNESVLVASNGGRLVSAPGDDDPATLTDGWRHGPDRAWSAPAGAPLEIVYELARTVDVEVVQLHQSPEHPSQDIEVLLSSDGVTYETAVTGALPESAPAGPNFAFLLERIEPTPAKWIRVRILSGFGADRWGLGEIEVFGSGAALGTDDDWVSVTADFGELTPGETIHYRIAAESDAGVVFGEDRTFTVPATRAPLVTTLPVSRIQPGTAKVEGRVSPLGEATNFHFEFGEDDRWDRTTGLRYAGLELTPRTVTDTLVDLVPGTTYHVRLVAENASGVTYGEDVTFVAR